MEQVLTVVAGAFYLVPFVIALLVLKKFFEIAQSLKESAEAQQQVAAAQREQTEMVRGLVRAMADVKVSEQQEVNDEQD